MAQPIPSNGLKELNLNKPDTFNGDREEFKKFLQDVEVYMDVNHKTYNNDLRKITFILSFITPGSVQLIKLEILLKTIDDWYKWAAILDHKHHKLN
jgi:Domain of unknown function (DUF4939)